jgi:hypothetical protein
MPEALAHFETAALFGNDTHAALRLKVDFQVRIEEGVKGEKP